MRLSLTVSENIENPCFRRSQGLFLATRKLRPISLVSSDCLGNASFGYHRLSTGRLSTDHFSCILPVELYKTGCLTLLISLRPSLFSGLGCWLAQTKVLTRKVIQTTGPYIMCSHCLSASEHAFNGENTNTKVVASVLSYGNTFINVKPPLVVVFRHHIRISSTHFLHFQASRKCAETRWHAHLFCRTNKQLHLHDQAVLFF